MKSSGIGGQAVLEGIMMRSGDRYSVGVRKPDGEIAVRINPYKPLVPWKSLYRIPIVRGALMFVESLVVGTNCILISSEYMEEEEEEKKPARELTEEEKAKADRKEKMGNDLFMAGTILFSLVMCIGLFIMLPYFASRLLKQVTSSETVITLMEAVIRLVIFFGYLILISMMKDIRRTYMYHGAEHKCINCIEHGLPLTVENVRKSSREHKRCGTSFLFFVVIVSIIFFLFIRVSSPVWRIVIRLLLIPVISGVSYEIIRLAGSTENAFVGLLSKPGLMLQHLTTAEPEDDMIEVAIAAVEAVFDWKTWQQENGF